MPLLIVLIGVILLIFMIVKLKLNTFVALVITSFIVALMLGLPLTKIPTTIETGIGGQLGHLAIIFGFGSMLGQLVSDAGGGYRIATTLIDKFGRRWIQVAVILASFIIGLALFFEVGLVVVLPIIFIIAPGTGYATDVPGDSDGCHFERHPRLPATTPGTNCHF